LENKNVRTNVCQFILDDNQLNQKYEVLIASIVGDGSKQSIRAGKGRFEKDLFASSALAMTSLSNLQYAILFKRGEPKGLTSNNQVHYEQTRLIAEAPLYKNKIVQLLLNQVTDDRLLPARNLTAHLIVSRTEWAKTLVNGRQQRYGLEVSLNWEADLQLNVTTFVELAPGDQSSERYFWNQKRGTIERTMAPNNAHDLLFKRGNTTHQRNNVDFLLIDNLDNFEQSKVGIAENLLTNLNRHFSTFCHLELQDFPIIQEGRPRLSSQTKKDQIWEHFRNKSINLYAEAAEPKTIELAKILEAGFSGSKLFKEMNIKVTLRDGLASGYNLHVIHNALINPSHPETHDVGLPDQIIQHLTVEGLGKLNIKTNQLQWQPTPSEDIANDSAINNAFQELVIKKDIRRLKISLASPELLKLTNNYQFYWFAWIQDNPATVSVIQARLSATGKLVFSTKQIILGEFDQTSELARVCQYAWLAVGKKQRQFFWEQIDGVIQQNTDYVMIQQTPRQLFPMQDELHQRQIRADRSRKLEKIQVIQDLATLATQAESANNRSFLDALGKFKAAIAAVPGPYITIAEVQAAIKQQQQINYHLKIMREVSLALEQQFGYTFHNSSRNTKPQSVFNGFKGMGLIKIKSVYHYYVGTNRPLDSKFYRAYRLRKLIPLTGDDQTIQQIFPDLMALMGVDFVRNGQYTVSPYMNKYLREYFDYTTRVAQKK